VNNTPLESKPIRLPGSPFWNVFRRFGRDELVAMVVNVVGTALVALVTTNPLWLVVAGPLLEKIGFFPMHFKDAFDVWKTTPDSDRKELSHYVKTAVKGGTTSLVEDVLVHDPVYAALMWFGIHIYGDTPAWLLAAFSFIVAVFAVAGLELAATELRFALLKRRMIKIGFKHEEYYESRFIVDGSLKPSDAIETMACEFDLAMRGHAGYSDWYLENKFKKYSGREPRVRLRDRDSLFGMGSIVSTLQIVFTVPKEMSCDSEDQCRFFPIRKEKLYAERNKPDKAVLTLSNDVSAFMRKMIAHKSIVRKVSFTRMAARGAKGEVDLYVSADVNPDGDWLMEIKSYDDVRLLAKAMRFAMIRFPVVQTTIGKAEM